MQTAMFTLGLIASATALTCPASHPELACGRCWVDFNQARSGADANCPICSADRDCGPFQFCGKSQEPNGCGTLSVCKDASAFNEACTLFNSDVPQCEQQGCGINLRCQSTFENPDQKCVYINNEPQPCVTGRCGRLIPHGESGPADDGCNTCSCNNGVLLCTKKACVSSEEPSCGPLKEGDVCLASRLAFSPNVDRFSEPCPDRTACRVADVRNTLFKCLPVDCTRDSHCESGEFCRVFVTRGGCRSFGTCEKISQEGESCFTGDLCNNSRCAEGLECTERVCTAVSH